jgi:hypothetical protein
MWVKYLLPNDLALSRVARLLPESILPANKETHLQPFFAAPCHVGCSAWLGGFIKYYERIIFSFIY